jgi:hypothetical protein
MKIRLVLLFLFLVAVSSIQAQDDTSGSDRIVRSRIVDQYIDKASAKAGKMEEKLDKKSRKALEQMQKLETKMHRQLASLDSSKARQIMGDVKQRYDRLRQGLEKKNPFRQYVPSIDSLTVSIKFLKEYPGVISNVKKSKEKLDDALSKVKGLENQFQKAEDIKAFLKERRQYLKEQLSQFGLAKHLKKLNKQVYYYSEQVAEYKDILNNQEKLERKALELLGKTRFFKNFMSKNSVFGSLFPTQPAVAGNSTQQTGFAALQTRAQMTAFIQQTPIGAAGAMPRVQQNIRDAQSQVNDMRGRILALTGRNGSNVEMPDFKPNTQKTKSFGKRLEYGFNVQSQKSSTLFPATSDLGLSVGYKLNDKSIIGIGASYKIGWGTGWRHISLSHQGAGLRSFIEWKVKDGFGLSGGYEINFRDWPNGSVIPPPGGWKDQQSGLIGLYKSVPLKTKFFKKTKLQLLWDFLSYKQRPQAQPIVFRVGYNF